MSSAGRTTSLSTASDYLRISPSLQKSSDSSLHEDKTNQHGSGPTPDRHSSDSGLDTNDGLSQLLVSFVSDVTFSVSLDDDHRLDDDAGPQPLQVVLKMFLQEHLQRNNSLKVNVSRD